MQPEPAAIPIPRAEQDTSPLAMVRGRGPTVQDIATRIGHSDGQGLILDGRFRLLRELGSGGMGTVYAAEAVDGGAAIAVKILDADSEHWLAALHGFLREASLAARIDHPNVVHMFERGSTSEGVVYLTMELLAGRSLRELLARETLDWSRVRRMFRQICAGVEAIHSAGVIHRDLKPSNCFVLDADDSIKILDFGIAGLEHSGRPRPGAMLDAMLDAIMGTPAYMSPEQIRGEPLDRRSDVYSAGALLFELVCGRAPFVGETARHVLAQQLRRSPPKLDAVADRDDLPPGLQAIVARALEKRPDARFDSMRALAAALADM